MFFYHVLESICICGVNLFILITGYFSVPQDTIKIRKIVNLLMDVAFWGTVGFLIAYIIGWGDLDIRRYIKIILPYFWGNRWFVSAYIILLLLIPFINRCLWNIGRKEHRVLIIIFTLLFCFWPSFMPSPFLDDYGYGFVHFTYMYLIASYMRIHITQFPRKITCLALFLFMSVVVCLITYFHLLGTGWAYNNLFVVLEAVALFLLFLQLELDSKFINILASCAFGVFLIHTDGFFSKLVYGSVFKAPDMVSDNILYFVVDVLACIPFFYLFGFALEYMKQNVFKCTVDRLLSKISILNKIISIK